VLLAIGILLASVMMFALACDDSSPVAYNPHQPFIPADPVPIDGGESSTLLTTLAWCGGDPDGDQVTYDVYLGSTRLPELVAEAIIDTNFTTGILKLHQTYYWRIVARDPEGNSISSPTWSFQTDVQEGDFVFPSTVGNSWTYRGANYYCNPRWENVGELIYLDTIAVRRVSEITSLDTLLDGREAYRINSTLDQSNRRHGRHTYRESNWYRNEADGQYAVATTLAGYAPQPFRWESMWPPMHSSKGSVRHASVDPGDSYYLFDPPRKEIAYPVEAGKQWVYVNTDFFRVEKTIVDRKTIQVPAGTFECWEIRWQYHTGDDDDSTRIEMTDYIADIGIVAHYLRIEGLELYGPASPDSAGGFVDYVEYYELEEYSVR
jgi:hypothetical protein